MTETERNILMTKVNLLENNNRILTQRLKERNKEIKVLNTLYQKEKELKQELESEKKLQDKFDF